VIKLIAGQILQLRKISDHSTMGCSLPGIWMLTAWRNGARLFGRS